MSVKASFPLPPTPPIIRGSVSKDREGQPEFRRKHMRAYGSRCAITGEAHDKVLEATHIELYFNEQSNHIQNGLLLGVDGHRLLDAGLLALDEGLNVLVSSKLKTTSYTQLAGKKLDTPVKASDRSSMVAINWHRRERFQP